MSLSESLIYSNFFESFGQTVINIAEKIDTFSKKVDVFLEEKRETFKVISQYVTYAVENIDKIDNFLNDTHRLKRIRNDLFELPLEETLEILTHHYNIGTFTINENGYIDFPTHPVVNPEPSKNIPKWYIRSLRWLSLEVTKQIAIETIKKGVPYLYRIIRDWLL